MIENELQTYVLNVIFAKNQPMAYNLNFKKGQGPNSIYVTNVPSYMGKVLYNFEL